MSANTDPARRVRHVRRWNWLCEQVIRYDYGTGQRRLSLRQHCLRYMRTHYTATMLERVVRVMPASERAAMLLLAD